MNLKNNFVPHSSSKLKPATESKTRSSVKFTVLASLLFAAVFGAIASQPKSIKHIEDVVDGDVIYGSYMVSCSNGKEYEVTAWDDKETWCLGRGLKDTCKKKQLKIAKIACRG